jgi:predicted dithiol-disulfide oxidoreductase (DUF899 family)
LVVYHFMFGPGWKAGCVGCSFFADHVDGANKHLAYHDVTFVAISRAPLAELEAYKKRMGWRFEWVSSCNRHGSAVCTTSWLVMPSAAKYSASSR